MEGGQHGSLLAETQQPFFFVIGDGIRVRLMCGVVRTHRVFPAFLFMLWLILRGHGWLRCGSIQGNREDVIHAF